MKYIVYSLFFCLLTSCGKDTLFEQKYTIPNGEWKHGDNKTFIIQAPDTSASYNLTANLTYTTDFPFENIYLNIKTYFPDGNMVPDQLSLEMDNTINRINCSNTKCDLFTYLQQNFKFKQVGEHRIEIEQYTRKKILPGITELGLAVEKL